MSVIEVNGITKDYGNHQGVFDVNFTVEKGEVLGFLGPNGAGKTTTIRQLMGFIKPDQGTVHIQGMDCFKNAPEVQAQFLELNPKNKMKKMSKGMKQKIGLVIAFMQDAPILILDEPTSGLDPLMQNKFVELIHKAKKEGKTILMSSHIFEEVEHTCDRVVIIKEGEIVATEKMEDLRHSRRKYYEICFHDVKEATLFHQQYPESQVRDTVVSLSLQGSADTLIKALSQYTIDDLSVRVQSLEELFLHYYGGNQS